MDALLLSTSPHVQCRHRVILGTDQRSGPDEVGCGPAVDVVFAPDLESLELVVFAEPALSLHAFELRLGPALCRALCQGVRSGSVERDDWREMGSQLAGRPIRFALEACNISLRFGESLTRRWVTTGCRIAVRAECAPDADPRNAKTIVAECSRSSPQVLGFVHLVGENVTAALDALSAAAAAHLQSLAREHVPAAD
jgi:hypothetical protein